MGIPKIRFKGYTEDWEQRKFSDLYSKVSEKNDLSFGTDKIISVANMYFKDDVKDSSEEYMRTYNIMRLGDIAFEGNKSKNYAHGRFVENTIGDGIVSHVFDVFRPKVDYDLFFWKYFINNEGVMGRIMTRCTKASTMMTNLVANDFLKEEILVPSIDEQKEIGKYLDILDHLITLHQRKCEETKKLKKYMLQKMFPQNGQSVPQIRFAGFTEDWEQRKVSNVAEIIAGGTPSTKENSYWEPKEIPWLSSGEVHKKYITFTDDMISQIGMNNSSAKMVAKDSVLIALAGQGKTRGTVAINRIPLTTNQSIAAMTFNEDFIPEFVFYNLENRYDELRRMSSGDGSRGGLNKQLVGDIEIPYTEKEEQEKIGSFFESLDHLITLHQRKRAELQNIKKYMLQNMFV